MAGAAENLNSITGLSLKSCFGCCGYNQFCGSRIKLDLIKLWRQFSLKTIQKKNAQFS